VNVAPRFTPPRQTDLKANSSQRVGETHLSFMAREAHQLVLLKHILKKTPSVLETPEPIYSNRGYSGEKHLLRYWFLKDFQAILMLQHLQETLAKGIQNPNSRYPTLNPNPLLSYVEISLTHPATVQEDIINGAFLEKSKVWTPDDIQNKLTYVSSAYPNKKELLDYQNHNISLTDGVTTSNYVRAGIPSPVDSMTNSQLFNTITQFYNLLKSIMKLSGYEEIKR